MCNTWKLTRCIPISRLLPLWEEFLVYAPAKLHKTFCDGCSIWCHFKSEEHHNNMSVFPASARGFRAVIYSAMLMNCPNKTVSQEIYFEPDIYKEFFLFLHVRSQSPHIQVFSAHCDYTKVLRAPGDTIVVVFSLLGTLVYSHTCPAAT